jgi:hypothetical protein
MDSKGIDSLWIFVLARRSNLTPFHEEAVSQCSGAIHRTQYVMSDKSDPQDPNSDRYSMLYGNLKKQDYDTVWKWRGTRYEPYGSYRGER